MATNMLLYLSRRDSRYSALGNMTIYGPTHPSEGHLRNERHAESSLLPPQLHKSYLETGFYCCRHVQGDSPDYTRATTVTAVSCEGRYIKESRFHLGTNKRPVCSASLKPHSGGRTSACTEGQVCYLLGHRAGELNLAPLNIKETLKRLSPS